MVIMKVYELLFKPNTKPKKNVVIAWGRLTEGEALMELLFVSFKMTLVFVFCLDRNPRQKSIQGGKKI